MCGMSNECVRQAPLRENMTQNRIEATQISINQSFSQSNLVKWNKI